MKPYLAVDNTQLDTARDCSVSALRCAIELNLQMAAVWIELAKINIRVAEVLSGRSN